MRMVMQQAQKVKLLIWQKTKTVSPAEYEALTGYDLSDFEN
ncbi:hypothetical protein S101258_00193 [Lactiplantibacillus plantarum subsp. plantarum]|uniref:XkdX family protein n=1 Tax=Lactiplantibacillus plantarum subsp. plantarum TaxID=337330 RepID=A0A2S3U9Q0_LACPN|nr:hypothetical protein S101258_00193 [Lactiplantibacillus plantarum subsp. plantarum]